MTDSAIVELAGAAEVLRETNLDGCGVWRSCTGCHETNEGAETGHYPYSTIFGCYLGGGCSECGGIGAIWEYWSEADLAALQTEAPRPAITAWMPEQDRHRLAVLGKLAEECSELSARAVRCVLQGLDEVDPDTGRANRVEMEREIADVMACIEQAMKRLGITVMYQRQADKSAGFDHWHDLIEEAGHAS